ncbi:hypothetical protein NUZ5A_20072 [Candidatus Nitrosotenuis uzonensis]|uniref:Uncharacterized protein n=1 Tax=Candidatus Nitrosotenuis uzonensis TaxID=1407055 RepID=A0A812ETB9_9ARCH|nr:hypothetical protein NUZ5A_20072 [Candidatus Nitrosotenuis uzonensis]
MLNSFGGYPIGYAIGIVILPVSVGWIEKDPLTVNLLITTVYATVSFLRSYYLRRFFAKFGIEDNIAVLAIKAVKKFKIGSYFRLENITFLKKLDHLESSLGSEVCKMKARTILNKIECKEGSTQGRTV